MTTDTATETIAVVNAGEFRRAITKAMRFRNKRSIFGDTIQQVLVSIGSDGGSVIGVSPDHCCCSRFSVVPMEDGQAVEFVASPDKLIAACGLAMHADEITLHVADSSVRIIGDRGQTKIGTADPKEFPKPSRASGDLKWVATIPTEVFLDAVARCVAVSGASTGRYALSGVGLSSSGDSSLVMVATDGRQACSVRLEAHCDIMPESVIVPKEFLQLLPSTIESSEITIEYHGNAIDITGCDGEAIWCRTQLIEGRLPDIAKIVSDSFAMPIKVKFETSQQWLVNDIKLAYGPADKEDSGAVIIDADSVGIIYRSSKESSETTIDANVFRMAADAPHTIKIDKTLLLKSMAPIPSDSALSISICADRINVECGSYSYILMGMVNDDSDAN